MGGRERDIDREIGRRLRRRREALGLSRYELALACDQDVEQLRRFEDGSATVTAAQLALFAGVLETPPRYFDEPASG